MSNEVLYRKYRPQGFGDVLGQDHVIKVLEGALKLGNMSHAYLFYGSRGTGKTSVARILAKELGTSENDIYEIDAASNRGIDDIRELKEAVRTLPFDSKYKVYIIDEVHMLTKEAFNALLKTLEEPPPHVIFVLATTELGKVPETIVSRCQTFTFKKPAEPVLKSLAIEIAKKEGFAIDPVSADLIALLSDGSFRDAHGIMQKIFSFSKDKKIDLDEIEKVVGAPPSKLVNEFIEALSDSDLQKGLEAVAKAGGEGIDMKVYLKLVLHKLRMVLLLRFAKDLREKIREDLSPSDFEFLEKLAAKKEGKISSQTLNTLLDCYENLEKAFIKELPLELALIKVLGQDK